MYSSQAIDNETGYITNKYEIFKHNEADTYSPTQLTDSSGNKYGPVISPDGTKIAYYAEIGAESHIHVMNGDGSGVNQLIINGYNQDPTWNPDGTKLMFSRAVDSLTHPDLYVDDILNGQLQNITNTAGVSELSPSWSAANKIAFTSTDSLPNASSTGISEIVTMNADASKIAFVEDVLRSGYKYTNIFIMDSNGTNVFSPPYYAGVEIDPTWSPFGEKIIYSQKDDGMILSIYNIITNSSGNSIWGSGNLLQASWGRN